MSSINVNGNRPLENFLREHGIKATSTDDILIACNLTYIATGLLTSVRPSLGAAFITLTTLVSIIAEPFISNWLNRYRGNALVPLSPKKVNLAVSLLIAKLICQVFGYNITFLQIAQTTAAFLVSTIILKYGIKKIKLLPTLLERQLMVLGEN